MSSTYSADEPSICIPRVSPDITSERIRDVFTRVLGAGVVQRVDIVPWRGRGEDGPRRVFVHLEAWPETEVAKRMRARLLGGEDVDLVYNDPWIWRCSRSRVPKPHQGAGRNHGVFPGGGGGVGGGRGGLSPALANIARQCT